MHSLKKRKEEQNSSRRYNKTEQCYCIKRYFYRFVFKLLNVRETDTLLFLKKK